MTDLANSLTDVFRKKAADIDFVKNGLEHWENSNAELKALAGQDYGHKQQCSSLDMKVGIIRWNLHLTANRAGYAALPEYEMG